METELKLVREPGTKFAEEVLKFRVPPDLMVIEDRWVMVGVGWRESEEQKCHRDEEASECNCPKVSLAFIPL